MAILQYWKDDSGNLKKIFNQIKKKYFLSLKPAKFMYTFRSKAKTDEDGDSVAAEASKLSNRERDIYGLDFEICVHEDTWDLLTKSERKQLAWHELNHCRVNYEDSDGDITSTPQKDSVGRLDIYMEDHDVKIKAFAEEMELFDPWPTDADTIWRMYIYCKNNKKKVKKARKIYALQQKDED